MWSLNVSSSPLKWEEKKPKGTSQSFLSPHSSHSVTYLNEDNKLVVIGRQSGQRRWSDTHSLDLKTLTWKLESSKVKSRSGHSAILLGTQIIVWGGRKSNDLDIISTSTLTCGNYAFPSGNGPDGTSYHSATAFGDTQLLIVGGITASTKVNKEIYSLNLKTRKWSKIDVNSQPLYGHSACLYKKKIFIFGGMVDSKTASDKLYILSFESELQK